MGQGRFESGTQTFESVALRACLSFQTGSKAVFRRTSLSQGSKKSLSRIEHSIRAAVSIAVLFNSRRSPRGNSFRYPSQGIPTDLNADPPRITAVDGYCPQSLSKLSKLSKLSDRLSNPPPLALLISTLTRVVGSVFQTVVG